MRKVMTILVSGFIGLFFLTGVVSAGVPNLTVRLEEPKSPLNRTDLPVTFVVLDIVGGRPISVVCEKRFETDGAFSQLGAVQSITQGGNTGTCSFDSSVISKKGTYHLKVTATAGADTSTDSISFVYNDEYPGDPRDYSKTKTDPCLYKIHFKTADDSGKTAKVEVYRSSDTSFTADSGSRVSTITIGSNTEYTMSIPFPIATKPTTSESVRLRRQETVRELWETVKHGSRHHPQPLLRPRRRG